ncbi:thioesterase [Clostridium carnis]
MGKLYSKEYEVHYYEVDSELNCTITTLINILCDVGTTQSEILGGGIEYLIDRNMAWVFYQYNIKVNRYPKCGEKIKAETKPIGFKKFYALREYKIYDSNGNIIVEAEAIFFLINIEKRKTMRVPKEQYDIYGLDGDMKESFKIERLERLQEPMFEKDFEARYSDIDFNRHVNNTKYIEWAIDSLPIDILNNYKLESIKVTFEKECIYGSKINVFSSYREEEEGYLTTLHKIESSDEKELTKLVGVWKKI